MSYSENEQAISRSDHLASVIEGSAKSSFSAVARPVLLRIPEYTLAEVDAMAKLANRSRNAMACELLALAIEEVRQRLNDETVSRLNEKTIAEHVELSADSSDRIQVKG